MHTMSITFTHNENYTESHHTIHRACYSGNIGVRYIIRNSLTCKFPFPVVDYSVYDMSSCAYICNNFVINFYRPGDQSIN